MSLPRSFTKWNHKQTRAYFSQPGVGRTLEQVIKLGGPDMYSAGNPVQASTTKLREISVASSRKFRQGRVPWKCLMPASRT